MTCDRSLGTPCLGLIPKPKLGLQTPMGGAPWFLSRRGSGRGTGKRGRPAQGWNWPSSSQGGGKAEWPGDIALMGR